MKQFQFAIARYSPDPIKGESINVGLVFHDLESKKIRPLFTSHFKRVQCIDPEVNVASLRLMLEVIEEGFLHDEGERGFLEEAICGVDGMITFSSIRGGLTRDPSEEIKKLFQRYIGPLEVVKNPVEKPEKFNQAKLKAKLSKDFYSSRHPILQNLRHEAVDQNLGIEFDFVHFSGKDPTVVIQPISLDVRDKKKLEFAKNQVFNAREARASYGYNEARMFALVHEPSYRNADAVQAAESVLERGFEKVITVSPGIDYLNKIIASLPS